jgi:hypothetical protein
LQKTTPVSLKIYLAIYTAISWFALLLQLYLIIVNRKLGLAATIVQYFSYFTILTNILVAICFTSLLLKPGVNNFFNKPKTLAAMAVYITIVGAIYNLVLRQLWNPQGWQLLADNLLHTVVPILFVGYWVVAVPKRNLRWKDFLPWLIYPAIYLVYILIRGALTNLYPYPFTDVGTYGYATVGMNSLWVMVGFIVVSLLFIAIAKWMEKFRLGK